MNTNTNTNGPFQPRYVRRFDNGHWVELKWGESRIDAAKPLSTVDASTSPRPAFQEIWMAPPLIDLQINGYAGVDFQDDSVTAEAFQCSVQSLRNSGCRRCLIALITDDWNAMTRRLSRLKAFRDQSPLLRSTIAGWHIEGPFLSPEPGFRGAHPSDRMISPTLDHIHRLREIVGEDPVLLTLAPEIQGAVEAVREAVKMKMTVCLGHTDASADQIEESVQNGATGFTHLGNGCPRQLDRHDNILFRVLDSRKLTVSLIPDGIHASPALFRIIHQMLPASRIHYTTDAMAAAGAPCGTYSLGRLRLEVKEDRVVRMPGADNFAGSALTPVEGVQRAARMLGVSWREAWEKSSLQPAAFMNIPLRFEGEKPDDYVFVMEEENGRLTVV